MSEYVQKAELPPSELGINRCFQIEYFGHGDIFISTWQGPIDLDPATTDSLSTNFGFAHGSDVLILASLAGYLRRLNKAEAAIREVLHSAGEDILTDDKEQLRFHHRLDDYTIRRTAHGALVSRFNIEEMRLECLVMPVPSQPGVINETGGTGIYTKNTEENGTLLVFAGLVPSSKHINELEVSKTADFNEADVPVIARLVCNLAMGEYRRDIQSFLTNLYSHEEA